MLQDMRQYIVAFLFCFVGTPGLTQTDVFDLTAEICRPDPVATAIVELTAKQETARTRVLRGDTAAALIVAYDHAARTVTLSDAEVPKTQIAYTLQEAQDAAITLSITDESGRKVSAIIAPELEVARVIGVPNVPLREGEGGPFDTITAPAEGLERHAILVRRLGLAGLPDDDVCGSQTAICTAEFNRMLGFGLLCAASLGGDIDSCNGASDAKCAWCDCKGYDCKGC